MHLRKYTINDETNQGRRKLSVPFFLDFLWISFPCLTFDYKEDEMMLAIVADIKWNAPYVH